MNFEQKLKEKIADSPFGSDTRSLLKLVLGEHQQLALKSKKDLTDEQGYGIVKKLIESNQKSLSYLSNDDPRANKLNIENEVLENLLPAYLTKEELLLQLQADNLAIKSYENDGQAIGAAMAFFKSSGTAVEGKLVKEAVIELRAS